MSEHPDSYIPAIPEVDQHGGDELPSYADLAAQHGPNSRYEHVSHQSSSRPQLRSAMADSAVGGAGSRRGAFNLLRRPYNGRGLWSVNCRAAERYADLTPEDFRRRRQKGWGEGVSFVVFRLTLAIISFVDPADPSYRTTPLCQGTPEKARHARLMLSYISKPISLNLSHRLVLRPRISSHYH